MKNLKAKKKHDDTQKSELEKHLNRPAKPDELKNAETDVGLQVKVFAEMLDDLYENIDIINGKIKP